MLVAPEYVPLFEQYICCFETRVLTVQKNNNKQIHSGGYEGLTLGGYEKVKARLREERRQDFLNMLASKVVICSMKLNICWRILHVFTFLLLLDIFSILY